MPKDKDASAPDYATMFDGESVKTCIVVRDGNDTRINLADFDAKKDTLSPNSHNVPEGYVAPTDKPKKIKQPKPGDRYTVTDDAGKFYLANKDGVKLNDTAFDTVELAAAAEATIEVA